MRQLGRLQRCLAEAAFPYEEIRLVLSPSHTLRVLTPLHKAANSGFCQQKSRSVRQTVELDQSIIAISTHPLLQSEAEGNTLSPNILIFQYQEQKTL